MPFQEKGFIFQFLLYLTLFVGGCSDAGTSLDPGVTLLHGSWVWQRSQGGFAGGFIFPTAGSKRIDTFSILGDYSRVVDGTLSLTAHYKMRYEGDYLVVGYSDVGVAGGGCIDGSLFPQYVTVDRDTLRLKDFGMDTYLHTYTRLK